MGNRARNVGWYRKHFHMPSDWQGFASWLYIEGAFHVTQIYLNGHLLLQHDAGYTSFTVRLDNATSLNYGSDENVLAIYVVSKEGVRWKGVADYRVQNRFSGRRQSLFVSLPRLFLLLKNKNPSGPFYGRPLPGRLLR
jgi:hypothetical protein